MSWLTFTGWYSRHDREGMGQECGAAGLAAPAVKDQRVVVACWSSAHFVPLLWSGTLTHGMTRLEFRVGLPTLINPILSLLPTCPVIGLLHDSEFCHISSQY